ncbi:MAG: four helix bundle protein [FCB group bacterium]|nr:four helix bundle protein [FCB group bacterium]
MSGIKNFKDLRIWENGMEIVEKIYKLTETFPKSEIFGLTNQMRRASVSIPANIAEGHAKKQTKEFSRYLGIALGSCAELETLLLIAMKLDYIDVEKCKEIIDFVISQSRQIHALKAQLKDFN